jgi:putative lipoprotein (rSAM/lipoprotein system)
MFKYLKEKKQKLLRFLFGSFSFTALMFTFQACYGMPGRDIEVNIQGRITDMETNEPVEGLQVLSENISFVDTTDHNGAFACLEKRYLNEYVKYQFTVTDIDSTENGQYETLDTVIYGADLAQPLQLKVKKVSDAQ